MKMYRIAQFEEYLYHGTGEGAFRQIRRDGLVTGLNGYLYLCDTEEYAESYAIWKGNPYGNRVFRVRKTDAMVPDPNTNYQGDFKSSINIPPENIEVKIEGQWIPIQSYYDEEIGIIHEDF